MESTFSSFPRIVVSQEICNGKPRIKGTRIPVSSILAYLAGGMSVEECVSTFQGLEKEDVLQVITFSNDPIVPLEVSPNPPLLESTQP